MQSNGRLNHFKNWFQKNQCWCFKTWDSWQRASIVNKSSHLHRIMLSSYNHISCQRARADRCRSHTLHLNTGHMVHTQIFNNFHDYCGLYNIVIWKNYAEVFRKIIFSYWCKNVFYFLKKKCKNTKICKFVVYMWTDTPSTGRSKWVVRDVHPLRVQIVSISCSFGGKIGQIIAFHLRLWS